MCLQHQHLVLCVHIPLAALLSADVIFAWSETCRRSTKASSRSMSSNVWLLAGRDHSDKRASCRCSGQERTRF